MKPSESAIYSFYIPRTTYHDEEYKAFIINGTFHVLSNDGDYIKRNFDRNNDRCTSLDEVIVVGFKKNDSCFRLFNTDYDINYYDEIYVINKDNKVIYSTENKDLFGFYRIDTKSLIIGYTYEKHEGVAEPQIFRGNLILDNQLTTNKFIGRHDYHYMLFQKSPNEYFIYDEEYSEVIDTFEDVDFVRITKWDYPYNFVYKKHGESALRIIFGKDEETFPIDHNITCPDWSQIQCISSKKTLILHYWDPLLEDCSIIHSQHGFTLMLEQTNNSKNAIKISTFQKPICKGKIVSFRDPLILFTDQQNRKYVYDKSGILKGESWNKEENFIRTECNTESHETIGYYDNELTRIGLLRCDDLKWVIPALYKSIIDEEICWEKKNNEDNYYDCDTKYYITRINLPANEEETESEYKDGVKEYYGIFKGCDCLLPCSYKNIEKLYIKKRTFLLLEDYNGYKGLFYDDRIFEPCLYVDVESNAYYIILRAMRYTFTKVYYIDDAVNLLADGFFDSAKCVSYSCERRISCLDFPEKSWNRNERALYVENKEHHYGLFVDGEMVLECLYDEIAVLDAGYREDCKDADGNSTFIMWFLVRIENKVGICDSMGEIRTSLNYSTVDVDSYGNNFVLLLDGIAYTADKKMVKICRNKEYTYRGFLNSRAIIFSNEDGTKFCIYDYKGSKLKSQIFKSDGSKITEDNIDCKGIFVYVASSEDENECNFSEIEKVFSITRNEVVENPYYQDEADEPYYPDDWDYDRDTYYALGGTDYEKFKENGGNLDDMMDGIGL